MAYKKLKITITAATDKELQTAAGLFEVHDTTRLNTGVGMVNTALHLGKYFATHHPDFVLNIGIAGAIDRQIPLCEVYLIERDEFAWFGAESPEGYIPFSMIGTFDTKNNPSKAYCANLQQYKSSFDYLKRADALTVQTVTGTDSSKEHLRLHYKAELESMEGAAFYYACHHFNMPCAQLRAVSNYVEVRRREQWKIDEALANLRQALQKLSENMDVSSF